MEDISLLPCESSQWGTGVWNEETTADLQAKGPCTMIGWTLLAFVMPAAMSGHHEQYCAQVIYLKRQLLSIQLLLQWKNISQNITRAGFLAARVIRCKPI